MTLDALARVLRPLATRVANLVGRGVVQSADASQDLQTLQVEFLPGEVRDDLEHFEGYGLTAKPLPGAEVVVAFINGRRDHGIALGAVDRRYRIKNLASGEVAVYNHTGAAIVMKANGDIEVTPKPGQVIALAGQTNPVAKGDSLNTAIATLGNAIAGALTAVAAASVPTNVGPVLAPAMTAAAGTITTAVSTFNVAAAAALSKKVKLS